MSVLLETSVGDITIDLLVDKAPRCCENFLKLCKIKYYNFAPVHSVQPNFSFQTGDPIGPGSKDSDGGCSIWGILSPEQATKRTFKPEFAHKLKHAERGTVSMATVPAPHDQEERLAASQFLVTLGDNIDFLDGKAAIFGEVVEGFDNLEKINGAFIDDNGRPLKDIRILHTHVLDDPFDDPPGLIEPPKSPVPSAAQLATVRIAHDEELEEEKDPEALERIRREREARAQALTLEMVGDLPFADVKPPENVLFVCKLNPVTRDEDLNLIFSRFGKIVSCEVIRDKTSGDSLQYAFIEFDQKQDCEQAYAKMENVLIDDHRIHVDFSQSVSRLSDNWRDATNSKRRRHGGGFGGIANLERKRKYRDDDAGERARERESDKYGYVQDPNEAKARAQASRQFEERRTGDADGEGRSRKDERYKREERRNAYHDDRWSRNRDRSRSPRRDMRDHATDGRYADDRRQRSRDRYRDAGRRNDAYQDRDDRHRRDRSRDRYKRDDRNRDRDRGSDRRRRE